MFTLRNDSRGICTATEGEHSIADVLIRYTNTKYDIIPKIGGTVLAICF